MQAAKERLADRLLDLLHMLTDRRLRHAERPRGDGEVLVRGGRLEGEEGGEGRQMAKLWHKFM
ncbi:hypothetical protein Acid7E03_02860 [Acidisoma sp. 7E03]